MRLHIPVKIWQKLQAYVELSSPNEVTGIGLLDIVGPQDLSVTEIILPRQKTSPALCEFADGEMNQIIYNLMEKEPNLVRQLCFRWHSHGQSSVFWSQKDEDDIEDWDSPWVVNLVMNIYGEYLVRYDTFSPLRVSNYPVDLVIDYPRDTVLRDACLAELQEKLHVRKIIPQQLAMRKEELV